MLHTITGFAALYNLSTLRVLAKFPVKAGDRYSLSGCMIVVAETETALDAICAELNLIP